MLSMLLAMLETEEDRERFLKLHGTYEKKLYAVAVRVLGTGPRRRTRCSRLGCSSSGGGTG